MRFLGGVLLSIIVHLLLVLIFAIGLNFLPENKPQPLTFEVLETPHKPTAKKQIVRDQLIPDRLKTDTSEDPLRFWSERTQNTKVQTKAYVSGLTKNRSHTQNSQKKLERFMPDKIAMPAPNPSSEDSESGISTISEDLSDIKIGSVTALNTDRYLYYSYFSRSQELLWNEWAPLVEATLDHPPAGLIASIHRHFTTIIEVWFYPDGTVHSSHIMKPSGVPEFDQIATESFRRVQRIPNPPREKIEADGLVRFKWNLTIDYSPKVLVDK